MEHTLGVMGIHNGTLGERVYAIHNIVGVLMTQQETYTRGGSDIHRQQTYIQTYYGWWLIFPLSSSSLHITIPLVSTVSGYC